MSWHFLQGQEAASWEGSSSDGAPDALSRLMPNAGESFSTASETDSSRGSQYGMTFGPSTESRGVASTLLPADSPVRTSQQPATALESTGNDPAYGWKWPASWAKYDPATRSWKTRQCSLLGGSEEFSGTWPRWGSMLDGECLALATPDWITSESASGSLPTPSGVNGGNNHTMGRVDEWGGSSNPLRGTVIGYLCLPEFEELVMGWPVTWTAPTPLEMDRFQRWLQWHGKSWPRE
jgi:hypothetical protein